MITAPPHTTQHATSAHSRASAVVRLEAAITRPASMRKGYIASKTPTSDVPWTIVQAASTSRQAAAPPTAATSERARRGVASSPRRHATSSATQANTPTSAMFCFTSSEATAAAPASAAATVARRSFGWLITASTATMPATTKGAASSSPLTCCPPSRGVTHNAAAVTRGPRRGPLTAKAPRDVRRAEHDQDGRQAADQPQRDQPTELGRDLEDGDQQGWPVHPVAAVERRSAGVPLLADQQEPGLVAARIARQERDPRQDGDRRRRRGRRAVEGRSGPPGGSAISSATRRDAPRTQWWSP